MFLPGPALTESRCEPTMIFRSGFPVSKNQNKINSVVLVNVKQKSIFSESNHIEIVHECSMFQLQNDSHSPIDLDTLLLLGSKDLVEM